MADEQLNAEDEQLAPQKTRSTRGSTSVFIFVLALVLIAIAVYGNYTSIQVKKLLQQHAKFTQQQAALISQTSNTLVNSIAHINQQNQATQDITQQGVQLVKELQTLRQGDLSLWYVAEAANLVRLANDLLQFSDNSDAAIKLLQRAAALLQNQNDANLFAVKKVLNESLAQLSSLPQINITDIYLKLLAVSTQIDKLNLPTAVIAQTSNALPSVNPELPWWQRGVQQSVEVLRKIVIIRKTDAQTPPVIMPDEKNFLYQNIVAQMNISIWGLLHRNQTIYQAGLFQAALWIKTYFVQSDALTQNVLQQITALQAMSVSQRELSLGDALQQFDEYFRNQQTENQLKGA